MSLAEDLTELTSDSGLREPITVTESGSLTLNNRVWTGTSSNGASTENHCSNWTSNLNGLGVYGMVVDAQQWSAYLELGCLNDASLLCIER